MCLGSGLPQTQHVALGVLEVSKGAHAGIGVRGVTVLPPSDSILLQGVVDAIDVDGDHRSRDLLGARIMPPLIAPGSRGIWVCSFTSVVFTVVYSLPHWHRLEFPAKDGAVEILGSINVVGWNFEMHDLGATMNSSLVKDVRITTLRTVLRPPTAGRLQTTTLAGHDPDASGRATGDSRFRVCGTVGCAMRRSHIGRADARLLHGAVVTARMAKSGSAMTW